MGLSGQPQAMDRHERPLFGASTAGIGRCIRPLGVRELPYILLAESESESMLSVRQVSLALCWCARSRCHVDATRVSRLLIDRVDSSAIVRCPHLVSLGVCQLKLYEVGVPALLVQTRGRHATKPVRHHFVSRVAQAPQSSIERVVADGAILRTQRRKQKARTSCEGRQILKDPKRLIRKRHKVRLASLHTCGRNTPKCVRKIHCSPFGVSQFAWANEYVGRKLQSKCHGRPAHRCVGAPRAAPEL